MNSLFSSYAVIVSILVLGQHVFPLYADTTSSFDKKLYAIKHTQSNFEQELAKVKERIQNQELILESMQQEVTTLLKTFKETQLSKASSQETQLKNFEKNLDRLVQDIKQLKNHTNETVNFQTQLQKKISDIDQVIHLQGQEIHSLESAVKALALAMQGKHPSTKKEPIAQDSSNAKIYIVKPGDTLEKIAKSQKVSIEALKECNNLQKDTIFADQELKLP